MFRISLAAVFTSAWQPLLVLMLGSHSDHEPSFSVQFQLILDFEAKALVLWLEHFRLQRLSQRCLEYSPLFMPRGDLSRGFQLWSGDAVIAS